jgi:hypothetical protein
MPWYAFFFQEKERKKRVQRRYFYEHSYPIAFRELKEEILYFHLAKDGKVLPTISITDKAHRQYSVDLNQVPFILQKKGIPFYTALQAIYEREGIHGLYREIDTFVEAIAVRIEKKIADADRDVEHNWGYVGGKLFHLDPGRLYYDAELADPLKLEIEWDRATHAFYKWLQIHYPEGASYLQNRRMRINASFCYGEKYAR